MIMVRKIGRAAKSPNLALRASFPAIDGDVPLKDTPPMPVRAQDSCLALHIALFRASVRDVPFKVTPPLQDSCPASHATLFKASAAAVLVQVPCHSPYGRKRVVQHDM